MSKFRTIEISDPRFEPENLRFITVKSPNLKGRGNICVFVPPEIPDDHTLPVVILLHGVYGSAWSWAFNAGIHRQVMEMILRKEIPPIILAMPSDGLWGDGSSYLPHHGYDFEKWIAEDVPTVLSEKINGVSESSSLFICGLSMGGFGALRIAAKYGHRFMGAAGHSSITSLQQMELFVEEDLSHYQQSLKADEDLFLTFKQYIHNLPPIRFDCGTFDKLLMYNRELHLKMLRENIPHEYEELTGGHEWIYWEKNIRKSLLFFMKMLEHHNLRRITVPSQC